MKELSFDETKALVKLIEQEIKKQRAFKEDESKSLVYTKILQKLNEKS